MIFFQKAMHQFEWHDGSIKNVHVDVALLYEYQVKLRNVIQYISVSFGKCTSSVQHSFYLCGI